MRTLLCGLMASVFFVHPAASQGGVSFDPAGPHSLYAAWSPDGYLAFTLDRAGNRDIYVMNVDGSSVQQLTTNDATDEEPRWSRDGKQIAFESNRSGEEKLYVMNANGSGVRQLTSGAGREHLLDCSPDGRQIVFSSNRDGNLDIYLMNDDGSNLVRLTNDPADDDGPKWSTDGKSILFFSSRGGRYGIYLMDSQGRNTRHLTQDHQMNVLGPAAQATNGVIRLAVAPVWSPDGRRIAFDSTRDGNWEIYTMAVDGSDVLRLTNHEAADTRPNWSPDGQWIAFQSWRHGGGFEIYVMRPDGTDLRRVTYSAQIP